MTNRLLLELSSAMIWREVTKRMDAAQTVDECVDAWSFGRQQPLSSAQRIYLVEVVEEALERVGRIVSQTALRDGLNTVTGSR